MFGFSIGQGNDAIADRLQKRSIGTRYLQVRYQIEYRNRAESKGPTLLPVLCGE